MKVLGMEETIEGVDESDIEGPSPESLVTFNQNLRSSPMIPMIPMILFMIPKKILYDS